MIIFFLPNKIYLTLFFLLYLLEVIFIEWLDFNPNEVSLTILLNNLLHFRDWKSSTGIFFLDVIDWALKFSQMFALMIEEAHTD